MLRPAIDCLLTAWFVMCNICVFGGRPPSSCPCLCLCRLVLVVLALGFVGWAVPVIVCTGIYCKLVLVVLALGFVGWAVPVIVYTGLYCCIPPVVRAMRIEDDEEDDRDFHFIHNKLYSKTGASEAAIRQLPLHTFAAHAQKAVSPHQDTFPHCSNHGDTKVMSCCICLARYEEGVWLRELPCTHHFHMACVDKWLRMNAACPLCQHEINRFAPEDLQF